MRWNFVATKQQQPLLLLNFGHIRQHLPDIGDTARIAVTHRNIDIGRVMLFKLTSVIPAFPLSDITPVQTCLLSPGICVLGFTAIQPEDNVSVVVVILSPFDNPSRLNGYFLWFGLHVGYMYHSSRGFLVDGAGSAVSLDLSDCPCPGKGAADARLIPVVF